MNFLEQEREKKNLKLFFTVFLFKTIKKLSKENWIIFLMLFLPNKLPWAIEFCIEVHLINSFPPFVFEAFKTILKRSLFFLELFYLGKENDNCSSEIWFIYELRNLGFFCWSFKIFVNVYNPSVSIILCSKNTVLVFFFIV